MVAGTLQALDQQATGGIGVQATGIADRQDGDVQGNENALGMLAHQGGSTRDWG
ncbi:hypothetical protein D3C86_1706420 [compost metagenome]